MNKHEIYEALKADGAKLPKAERFMKVAELEEIYLERFGVSPGEAIQHSEGELEEMPNSHLLQEGWDECEHVPVKHEEVHLLRFVESGWCPVLKRSYTRGLYRPKTFAEYEALKPYAEEVL